MAKKPSRQPKPTIIKFGASGEILHRFVQSRKRHKIIIGPLGSGKTTTTIQHLMELIVSQKVNQEKIRKSRWVAIRNTYPDLETTTIPDFLEIFTEDFGILKKSNPPVWSGNFKLRDDTYVKSEVIFLALDQPEDIKKLRGTQFTGGWCNEIKEIPKEIYDMLDGRIGRFPSRAELGAYYHGILGDTNAPDEDHWLFEMHENCPENTDIFIQPGGVYWLNGEWVLNPRAENLNLLPEGYYANVIQGKKKDWIQVNIANEFGSVKSGKPVHSDFSRDFHVSERPLPIEPGAIIYVGIDFGRTPAATFGQFINNQWRILREIVTEDMGAHKFGGILRRFMNREFENMKFEIYGDPSGDDPGQNNDDTAFMMLEAQGITAFPCYTNLFSLRSGALDNLLCTVNEGQPAIILDPSCKKLISGLNGGYQFKRLQVSGEAMYKEKPNKNMHSHVCESCHYLLIGAGEADSVMGTVEGTNEMADVENEEDFSGWHPEFTGTDGRW